MRRLYQGPLGKKIIIRLKIVTKVNRIVYRASRENFYEAFVETFLDPQTSGEFRGLGRMASLVVGKGMNKYILKKFS